jgi:hypothetical protein
VPNRTCTVPGCDKPYRSKGYCQAHYARWRLHGDPNAGGPLRMRRRGEVCSVVGCGYAVRSRGLCRIHYGRLQATGRLTVVSDEGRFWRKVVEGQVPEVDPTLGPCWLWTGAAGNGYGTFYLDRTWAPAHRVAYEWLRVEIPPGLHLDHLCRVTRCVNPWHTEPVTPGVNTLRARAFHPRHACPSCHCA